MPNNMPLTSAYGGQELTVSTILKDPMWLPDRLYQNMDLAFMEDALLRDAGSNSGVVAYRETAAPFLNDKAREVAEFGEIPVSGIKEGEVKALVGVKFAQGIRVSYEMRTENNIDMVNRQVIALQNTMTKSAVDATLAAFKAAEIPTVAVSKAWTAADSEPFKDLATAKRKISQAKTDDNQLYGYMPDTLVIAESAIDLLLNSQQTQAFFQGNMADKNPVYTGVLPYSLRGLRVVTSPWLTDEDVYVMQSGVAGFRSDTIPLKFSPLAVESGDPNDELGGNTMSWRMNAVRKRIIAITDPKAVVKLTGLQG